MRNALNISANEGIIELLKMTDVLVPLPESLLDRLERLSASSGDVGAVLGRVIAESVPEVPEGLPEEIQRDLESLESLSEEELRKVALAFVSSEDMPEYTPGGLADQSMLRKAYANVILKWRGCPVSEEDLSAACQNT